jgi:hypothetical protein
VAGSISGNASFRSSSEIINCTNIVVYPNINITISYIRNLDKEMRLSWNSFVFRDNNFIMSLEFRFNVSFECNVSIKFSNNW